jgi:hypothetical protein
MTSSAWAGKGANERIVRTAAAANDRHALELIQFSCKKSFPGPPGTSPRYAVVFLIKRYVPGGVL